MEKVKQKRKKEFTKEEAKQHADFWMKISIGQFEEIGKISEKHQKLLEEKKYIEIDHILDLLECVNGVSRDEMLQNDALDVYAEFDKIKWVLTPPKPAPDAKLTIKDRQFVVCYDPEGITTAQYLDYCHLCQEDPTNIAGMCSIFCVPKGKKYLDGYSGKELEEFFKKNFPIPYAMGISFFFTLQLKTYAQVTLAYLKGEIQKEMKKEKKAIRKDLVEMANERITMYERLLKTLEISGDLISGSEK